MTVELKLGDVFLTRGYSPLSRAIRFFTRGFGEKRTRVNHVGLVVEGGSLESAVVVEAVLSVACRKLWLGYGPPKTDSVAVFRATNLSGGKGSRGQGAEGSSAADAFRKADKHFGVVPGAASPDDIWDFVAERKPSKYVMVRPLIPLSADRQGDRS